MIPVNEIMDAPDIPLLSGYPSRYELFSTIRLDTVIHNVEYRYDI
jgi:hypothetical protein